MLFRSDPDKSIELKTKYANQYSGGGNDALIDGIKGSKDFRSGSWQGYEDKDVIAIIDLGKEQPIHNIKVNFLVDQRSFIFSPTEVLCYVSNDTMGFQLIGKQNINATQPLNEIQIRTLSFDLKDRNAQYVKLVAKKIGRLPKWHSGYESYGKSWIFVDEISIE